MKRSLFYLAASVLALSACTSEEVVDENRIHSNAIGFENAVSKQTRAEGDETPNYSGVDVSASNLNHFSVFGYYTNPNATNKAILVLNNELVSKTKDGDQYKWLYDNTRYWVPGATYYFYAYSCGDIKLNSNYGKFAMDLTGLNMRSRALRITDYICDNSHQHDLLFACNEQLPAPADNTNANVAFKFRHILSRVDAEFTSEFAPEYTVEITNVKISNIRNQGDFRPAGNDTENVDWVSLWSGQERKIDDNGVDPFVMLQGSTPIVAQNKGIVTSVDGTTEEIEGQVAHSGFAFVMPYVYTELETTLSFDVAVKKDGDLVFSTGLSGSWKPVWEPGKRYTYSIRINGDATHLNAITFSPDNTEPIAGWEKGGTDSTIDFSAN